jgi:2-succinyl-5-enolpyruvyl-6-hydroxy-3-cyclohexene-1-carboxylate synthase
MTLVVVNNDGGGIFHFLPVVSQTDVFEEHIATPSGVDFKAAAALFGCAYEQPQELAGFGEAVSRSLIGGETTVIEVRTERAANRELHRDLEQMTLSAVRRELQR